MKKYIAKPNTWFDEGTEITIIDDYNQELWNAEFNCWSAHVLASGLKNGKYDEEMCCMYEFEVIDE